MTGFFYVLGWVITVLGVGYCFLVAAAPPPETVSGMYVVAKIAVMIPGFGVAGSGLIFVAVGAVLARLDRLIDSVR